MGGIEDGLSRAGGELVTADEALSEVELEDPRTHLDPAGDLVAERLG